MPNEGNFGMGWGNNHTHLHKFKDNYYLFYHSTMLEQAMKEAGAMDADASGYRSIGVDKATVNESTQTISKMTLTRTGVEAVGTLNPYRLQEAETMVTSGGIGYEDFTNIARNTRVSTLGNDASRNLQVRMGVGAWTELRHVDFGSNGASQLMLRAKGEGTVEIRVGRKSGKATATFQVASDDFQDYVVDVDPAKLNGQKTVFIVVSAGTEVFADAWLATEAQTVGIDNVATDEPVTTERYDLSGRHVDGDRHRGIVIEQYTDRQGKKYTRKRM